MGRCRQCNVEILDDTQMCPLCKCVIIHEGKTENTYPDIRIRARKLNFAVRIFFICVNPCRSGFCVSELEIFFGNLVERDYRGGICIFIFYGKVCSVK